MNIIRNINPLNWINLFPGNMETERGYGIWGEYIASYITEYEEKNIQAINAIAITLFNLTEGKPFYLEFSVLNKPYCITFNVDNCPVDSIPELGDIIPDRKECDRIKLSLGDVIKLKTGEYSSVDQKAYGMCFSKLYSRFKNKIDMSTLIILFIFIMTIGVKMTKSNAALFDFLTDYKGHSLSVFMSNNGKKENEKQTEPVEVVSVDFNAPQEVQDLTLGRIQAAINGNEKIMSLIEHKFEGKITGITIEVPKKDIDK